MITEDITEASRREALRRGLPMVTPPGADEPPPDIAAQLGEEGEGVESTSREASPETAELRAAVVDVGDALDTIGAALAEPGAVADLVHLDAAGARIALAMETSSARALRARLAELSQELPRERDAGTAWMKYTEAREIAAKLGPPPPRPDLMRAVDALRTVHEIPFLCRRLQLAPGRPPALVGYAGDGKSTAAIALAAAFATGRHAWSCLEITASRVCRVAYVDLDMGREAAAARVAGVLRAEAFTEEHLDGATFDVIDGKARGLRLRCSGRVDIPTDADEAAYFKSWRAVLAAYDLVIVDNLRKLAPRMNFDNDTRAAMVLDLLGDASTDTGSVPLVLAHSPKGGGMGRALHQSLKGKADLEGATGANLTMWRDEEGRRHLELTRPVDLVFDPLVGFLDLHNGATVLSLDKAAAKPTSAAKGAKVSPEARDAAKVATREAAAELLIPDVVKAVLATKKRGAGSRDLRAKVKGNDRAIDRAAELATERGLLVVRVVKGFDRRFAPSFAPPEPVEAEALPLLAAP